MSHTTRRMSIISRNLFVFIMGYCLITRRVLGSPFPLPVHAGDGEESNDHHQRTSPPLNTHKIISLNPGQTHFCPGDSDDFPFICRNKSPDIRACMVNRCYVDGPSVITEVHQDGGGAGVVLQCPTAPPNAGTVTAPKSIPTAYPDSLSPPKDGEVNATMPQNIRPSVMFEVSTLACLLLLAVGVVASVCYFQRLKKKLLNKDPAAAPFVQAQNIAFRCWPPRSWPVSFHTDGSDAILRRNAEMHCSR